MKGLWWPYLCIAVVGFKRSLQKWSLPLKVSGFLISF